MKNWYLFVGFPNKDSQKKAGPEWARLFVLTKIVSYEKYL
jgi:hypothetical protein